MFKAAFILAASASALGLATLSLAQEATNDELYYSINQDPGPWFLQRSTCTLAHNVNGDSIAVVRLRIGMGVELEFLDPALRRVEASEAAPFVVAVDGVTEEGFGIGIIEGDRQGYRLSVSPEMLDRIGMGRRLEATTGGRTLLRLDLAGAPAAIAAMNACNEEAANAGNAMTDGSDNMTAMDMDVNRIDAMEDRADALQNAAIPEDLIRPEPK